MGHSKYEHQLGVLYDQIYSKLMYSKIKSENKTQSVYSLYSNPHHPFSCREYDHLRSLMGELRDPHCTLFANSRSSPLKRQFTAVRDESSLREGHSAGTRQYAQSRSVFVLSLLSSREGS